MREGRRGELTARPSTRSPSSSHLAGEPPPPAAPGRGASLGRSSRPVPAMGRSVGPRRVDSPAIGWGNPRILLLRLVKEAAFIFLLRSPRIWEFGTEVMAGQGMDGERGEGRDDRTS